ncbi:hypothetical protein [Absidia glauca]|uniref:Uncharacterized protein n=1 Tax=Absidia glauca TaxID=4829 RepID=A0A168RL80_ABSGL|nr:hypothetical protein [Absidia glauca]
MLNNTTFNSFTQYDSKSNRPMVRSVEALGFNDLQQRTATRSKQQELPYDNNASYNRSVNYNMPLLPTKAASWKGLQQKQQGTPGIQTILNKLNELGRAEGT